MAERSISSSLEDDDTALVHFELNFTTEEKRGKTQETEEGQK